jgi:virulence-associated protein VagC
MEPTKDRAKLFRNGGSQAVRLPKEFQFEGKEVKIRREGQMVILEPVGFQLGAKDLEAVRKVIQSLEPTEPEAAAMMEEAMKKLGNG